MAWTTRICGEDLYHHVYAWGNNRNLVFKEPYHYRKYLELIKKYSAKYNIDLVAYALMQWHVHLFIYDRDNSISQFIFGLHGDYAQYFNKDTKRVGHVFGERFNNKIVQANEYGLWLSKYIHRQPLAAGLVDDPKDYPWTSYRKYLGLEDKDFIKDDIVMEQFGTDRSSQVALRYEAFVNDGDEGPIDWGSKKINITIESMILAQAASEFGLSRKILLQPRGWAERQRRQAVIVELAKKNQFSICQIAKAFDLAPSTVSRLLKDRDLGNAD